MDRVIHRFQDDTEEQMNYEQMIINRVKLGLTPQNIADEIWEIILGMVKDGRLRLEVTDKGEK